MQSYLIGVDIGTGSAKAVALNSSGQVIGSSQIHYSMLVTPHGYSEQDTDIVWHAFVNCIREVVNTLQHVPFAVSLSSCMHSLIVVNEHHLPVTHLISWADTRSEKIADEIRASEIAELIYRQTGTPIHSMSPLCKIIWINKHAPGIFAKAHKFISIKEFIWHKLFNAYQVDQSIASGTGLFNIETLNWNNDSLKLCGISSTALSEIVSTSFIRDEINPSIAAELSIPAGTQFCIGASDGCLANLGSFAMEKGTAAITIGTSGAVRVANESAIFNFDTMTFNYVLDEETFICGGPVNNGGNILKWLIHSFLNGTGENKNEYDDFFKKIDTIPSGSQGLLFLPYLHGERAPVWDEKASGVYFGIKSYHNQSHFLRAGLEGVCYVLKNILQTIEQSTSLIQQLNVSGGFINSELWVQILADVTGKKICLVQTEDASAIGAAFQCMKALNKIKNYSLLQPVNNIIVEPVENNHTVYEKYYPVFKSLYTNIKDSMHQLDEINNR
ncbi:MAG: gluconokinase [Ginsengibacter sp.]